MSDRDVGVVHKLVVFDIDGTLLDNLATEDECYVQALRDGLALNAVSAEDP